MYKLQITKETIKNALKIKYDTRLKEMKNQFEMKFKKNDFTWRNRLQLNRQHLQKEQLRVKELEGLLEEMTKRIN